MLCLKVALAQNPILTSGEGANRAPTQADSISLEGLAEQDVERFLSLLSDEQARRLLFERLKAERGDATASNAATNGSIAMSASFLDRIRSGSKVALDNIAAMRADLARFGEITEHAFYLITDVEGWPRMIEGFVNLAMIFLVGILARYLVYKPFSNISWQLTTLQPKHILHRLFACTGLLLVDLIALAAFTIVGYAVSLFFFERFNPMRLLFIAALGTAVVSLAGRAVGYFLFSPGNQRIRLVRIGDRNARIYVSAVTCVAFASSACYFFFGMFQLLAVPQALLMVWSLVCGAGVALFAAVALLALKFPKSETSPTLGLRGNFADLVMPELYKRLKLILLGFVGAIFCFWATRVVGEENAGVNGALICCSALALSAYLSSLDFQKSLPENSDVTQSVAGLPAPHSPLAVQFIAAVSALVGVLGFLQAAGIDLQGYINTPRGSDLAQMFVELVIVLFLAFVAWGILSSFLQRFIQNEHKKALEAQGNKPFDDEGGSGVVTSRLGTLLPIFRGFSLVFIVAVTAMSALSAIGIDIGPLLAGAGVVGIAIGFGAQALVRDIFAGVFFLVDDAFRVGEYVEFAEYRGEIEQLSIRSMRLRHHRGAVHTIPYGELRAITNHNRDWVIYKQEFQVPYEADIEQIRKIVKRIGRELMEDPTHGPKMMAPLKSQGVRRVENGALVISTKFKCRPREQWVIRRVVYQRVRDELYKAGIELAHRRVQIEMPINSEAEIERSTLDKATHSAPSHDKSLSQIKLEKTSLSEKTSAAEKRAETKIVDPTHDLSPQSLGAAAVQAARLAAAIEEEEEPEQKKATN